MQGQPILFIDNAAIKHAVILVSNETGALVMYFDGETPQTSQLLFSEVYTTDRDAVSAFIRQHGSFPLGNSISLRFDMEIDDTERVTPVEIGPVLVGA